jgi:hypothetical protein
MIAPSWSALPACDGEPERRAFGATQAPLVGPSVPAIDGGGSPDPGP